MFTLKCDLCEFIGSSAIAQCVVNACLLFLKCGMNFKLFENDENNVGLYWIGEWVAIYLDRRFIRKV